MKKVLLVLFVLLSLTACNKKFSKGEVVTAYADEVLEKLENKESFIVYVGYDDCQSCKEFKPILNQLIENYDITIYYLPTDDKQTEDQLNEIQYNYFYRMYWTPTTYIVEDGEVLAIKEQLIEYEELVEWLKEYGKIE
ncbi:MAG: thioredoxin family protein [Erysipelotrichaceae bacterium]|nr:thioredoxin family protein [Erysipelotrichaceae bacterium]MDY3829696.1 thioredoxin family protein [Erysipelotrichaceae bacterium]MDY5728059.1 thioredoxin family protein [Erysipelotrichaceae bacterium]